jgi:glycosyltransferase involved in cell wall biosynthesis
LQDSVELTGFLANPYACMARAAVLAFTSSKLEGLPTVLIESLAVGTPVVSTDCDHGPREILRGGAFGTLVPIGNVSAMARAIALAVGRPRPTLPTEGLRPFTVDTVLRQFQQVLGIDA